MKNDNDEETSSRYLRSETQNLQNRIQALAIRKREQLEN